MAPIIRQTITQKKISFSKMLFMVLMPILIMDTAIKIFSRFSPIIGTIGGLATLVGAVIGCMMIIYKHVAYFNYKMIDNELIMEKVFGKANHLFLSLKLSELEQFKPYQEINVQDIKNRKTKLYKFVAGRNMQGWYVGEFTRSGDKYMFIIEPNEDLLNAILSFQTE